LRHHFITGVAGFIGSHLADCLLGSGDCVSGVDDLSRGKLEHLAQAGQSAKFRFYDNDISRPEQALESLRSAIEWAGTPDIVWHFAANSDIPTGTDDASVDFRRTLQTTFAILEAAKCKAVKNVAFASTSAVYGERSDLLTENSGLLLPISNYGATKLASEALLSAAAELFLEKVWIFRFPNVVGPRPTHGAILDFVRRLAGRPASLRVLGDGSQTKPYLHVSDLISAVRFIVHHTTDRRNVYNIGPAGEGTSVAFIAEQTVARILPGTPLAYAGGDRGWVGDVPQVRYSTEKLAKLGWRPRLTSDEAVLRAIDEIASASYR